MVLLMLGLVIFGIIMVFSASYYTSISESGDAFAYLKDHIKWALAGLLLFFITSKLHYKWYKLMAPFLLVASLVLLALLFTPLGVTRHYATRWIGVGNLTLMPGEITKIFAIIFVAWFLSYDPNRIRSFLRGVLPLLVLCGVYFVLIIKQPNLSTAITVCLIIVGMMFVAGLNIMYLISVGVLGAGGILALIMTDTDGYWLKRLTDFRDPFLDPLGAGWQVRQSLLALGSGGLLGQRLGNSIQKSLYLPEAQNDFILAIIGEELGFLGVLALIIAYIFLIWRGTIIAINASDMFGTLIASGITIMLAVQVILNIAVVTSSMPPTGITLPFISYGGNALLLFMGSFGILLNISKNSRKNQRDIEGDDK